MSSTLQSIPDPRHKRTISASWTTRTLFEVQDRIRVDGVKYECILQHTATAKNKPGQGDEWELCWKTVAMAAGTRELQE
ncbi:hypothetical protein CALVIDRAFT_542236 [Calocera viscosa TUFC12733]|uniref:Uncharacterized protein n=1 Tax=Calocera viscosa (strain TUFC12733) TaxID=1330018 RepID=A0A167GWB5_CALVF|nr:hypothetical protein CALVIDRAFT_542236 [Calocera viscosa TUFC12733]